MTTPPSLFEDAGPLREQYAGVDWSATPLGPPASWSPALRTAVAVCLASPAPAALCWGEQLTLLYNDAYRPMIGDKHPHALGRPAREVFAEFWEWSGPALVGAWAEGRSTYREDEAMVLERRGFREECYFTSSLSAVPELDGSPGGVFAFALETTAQVLDRRRLDLLRQLGDLSEGLDLTDVSERALTVLRAHSADLPEVDLLLPGAAGLVAVEPAGRLASALSAGHGTDARVVGLAVPLPRQDGRLGALLVRTSELVADDEAYRAFLVSVARTVSAALSAAVAYQAERVRADAQAALAHRLEQLVSVAQLLGAAHTDDEVLEVLTHHGLDVLGATTGSLALLDDHDHRGQVRAFTARSGAPADLTVVPLDLPVPMVHVAREGHELLLPDRDATLALFPEADRLMERADASAVASLPLRVGDRRLGSCTLTWPEARSFTAQDVELLRALAVLLAQALDRVAARRAEQRSALAVQRMSETLQRSLLTSPPRPEGLQIAVRYSPASEQAQVGGDWYDAFSSPDGSTSLVIGDVTGHDRDAAAAMGQMRNLLRATAYAVPGSPATVLAALEATMIGLEADALATAVLAQVGTAASGRQRGERVLRWCNAGHLPPVLHLPDGTVRMLAGDDPDLLLGMGEVVWRADTEALLPTGATLLLYTDGLVERRGESLDEGVARLCATVEQLAPMPLEQMCDELLRALLTSPDGQAAAADDVAILALRVHPLPDPPLVPLRPGEQRVVLPAEPVSVAQARRMATGACVDLGRRDLVDAVALLVSEVVTNAIRHGLGDVRVAVLPIAGGLRVEVGDDEPHEPVPRSARLEDEGGRGLALVEALAEDWGTAPAAVGKVVWFEVGTAPA